MPLPLNSSLIFFFKFRLPLCLPQPIVHTISTSESTCELVPIVPNSSPQFITRSFNSPASVSISTPLHVLLLQRNQAIICYPRCGFPPLIIPVLLCIDSCIHCSFHVEIRLSPISPFSFCPLKPRLKAASVLGTFLTMLPSYHLFWPL